ncbi:hypothetical protein BJY19_001131 [Arthrobacter cupressi]|nr:hypothetical protein [Arthrobacter cupressi]
MSALTRFRFRRLGPIRHCGMSLCPLSSSSRRSALRHC